MTGFSRRQLANYAVNELLAKKSASQLAKRLAATLVIAKRQKEVELLLSDIDRELENRGLLAKAQVTAAHQLSDKLRAGLAAELKLSAKVREVVIEESINPAVIGGLQIETANHSWDNTIARKLSDIKGGR